MKAIGVHVFAGGFTLGVQRVMPVEYQLETHGFALDTAEKLTGVKTINGLDEWIHDKDCQLCFGNPRCTGFSCITSNAGESAHGPWSKPTQDIHELSEYAAGKYDIIVWESVQQAFTTGRPLLDYLIKEIYAPRNYRIAHVLLSAASCGNAQHRKRYFFVAYRDDRNFNIVPPEITPYRPTAYDAIWHLRDRETHEYKLGGKDNLDYTFDSYESLTPDEKECLPHLMNGWNVNTLAKEAYWQLPSKYKKTWKYRGSDMPFSMHCPYRLHWTRPFPTIHSSARRFIHPDLHRPLTVGEIATAMGWPDIPTGPDPIAQIAKGVCPGAGEWLAQQAVLYLNDEWGSEDWESSYDDKKEEWVGRDTTGEREKVFNLTRYVGKFWNPKMEVHPYYAKHRFNFYPDSHDLIEPWKAIINKRRSSP